MAGTGKSYRGQTFVPVKSVEDVIADQEVQAPYDKEGAIPIEVWFSLRGHRDPVVQASMLAYTKVRRAVPEDWDAIFERFGC